MTHAHRTGTPAHPRHTPSRPDRRRSAWSLSWLLVLGLAGMLAAGCGGSDQDTAEAGAIEPVPGIEERTVRVTATTNIIADLAEQVGGERVEVTALMGPGTDPHDYTARPSDINRLRAADLIAYGGHDLEGKMADLMGELSRVTPAIPLAEAVDQDRIISEDDGAADPHVWFDPELWAEAAAAIADALSELDPAHADTYATNLASTTAGIEQAAADARAELDAIPADRRLLVTSHDAFAYLARAFDLEVEPIQGISTVDEAAAADIERVAAALVARDIAAVFVESATPDQTMRAVIAAAAAQGHEVAVGGELFADAAGAAGTPEASWDGMLLHNARTIARGLG